jgi:ferredoxin, 2Fe-2S
MTTIIFGMPSGEKKVCEAEQGKSVMQVAVANLVDGIVADCGGYATCATCHVYVDKDWIDKLPPPDEEEEGMLEVAEEPLPNSRLSCQIHVEPAYDGLLVHVPESSL